MKAISLIVFMVFTADVFSQINTPELLRKNKVHTVICVNSVSLNSPVVPSEIHEFIDSLGYTIKQIEHMKNESQDSYVTTFNYNDKHWVIGELTVSSQGRIDEMNRIDSTTFSYKNSDKDRISINIVKIRNSRRKSKQYRNDTIQAIFVYPFGSKHYKKVIRYNLRGEKARISKEQRFFDKNGELIRLEIRTRNKFARKYGSGIEPRSFIVIKYFYDADGLLKQVIDHHSSDHVAVTTNYTYLKRN
jgi:hypothetical protein